jgi:hypothetical protein
MVTPVTARITTDEFEAFVSRPENGDGFYELVDGCVRTWENTEEMSVIDCNIGAAAGGMRRVANTKRVAETVTLAAQNIRATHYRQ